MPCLHRNKRINKQYFNPDIFITSQLKHKCFQIKQRKTSYIYTWTEGKFLQRLRSPFDRYQFYAKRRKMLALILTATLIAATDAQDCNYSSICANHTMCQYPTTEYGPKCLSPVCSGLNATYQQLILDAHNDLRRRVAQGLETQGSPGPQPPAANMRKLKWDTELATIAQRWANQCILYQDRCRNIAEGYVGQNIFASFSNDTTPDCTQNWDEALQYWYEWVKEFDSSSVCPFKYNSGAGSYIQTVWADTYRIGCAFTMFSGPDGWYRKWYVCNYFPDHIAVEDGSCMYKIGTACSACPAGTTCDNSLCV